MLSGINTPGLPLDAVSHLKFHLRARREAEDLKDFEKLLQKLSSSTPTHVVLVAACAILPDVSSAAQQVTDDLTIVMDAISVFGESADSMPIFFGVNGSKGLTSEESYWSSAIQISQYLDQMDASSATPIDKSIMPLLALSRLKSSKISTSGKTLRLIQSLLLAAILSFNGKVTTDTSRLYNYNNNDLTGLPTYLKHLETRLLYTMIMKPSKGNREFNVQQLINKQLELLDKKNDDALSQLKLDPAKISELLIELHKSDSNPQIQDDIHEAAINFAVLLACQPGKNQWHPDGRLWRFDGLNGLFHLEHIAPQNPRGRKVDVSLLHRLGNFCLLEPELNSQAGNKQFLEKKKVYKESAFFTPYMLSSNTDQDFLEHQIIDRHEKMLILLHNRLKTEDIPEDTLMKQGIYRLHAPVSPMSAEVLVVDSDSPVAQSNLNLLGQDLQDLLKIDEGSLVRVHFPMGCKASSHDASLEQLKAVLTVRKWMNRNTKKKTVIHPVEDYGLSDQRATFKGPNFITKETWNRWRQASKKWWENQSGHLLEKKYTSSNANTTFPSSTLRDTLSDISLGSGINIGMHIGHQRRDGKRPRDSIQAGKSIEEETSSKRQRTSNDKQTHTIDEMDTHDEFDQLQDELNKYVSHFHECMKSAHSDNGRIHTLSNEAKHTYNNILQLEEKMKEFRDDFIVDIDFVQHKGILNVGDIVFDRREGNIAFKVISVGVRVLAIDSRLSVTYTVGAPKEDEVQEGTTCFGKKNRSDVPSKFLYKMASDLSVLSPRRKI
jgi:hypothetical protein